MPWTPTCKRLAASLVHYQRKDPTAFWHGETQNVNLSVVNSISHRVLGGGTAVGVIFLRGVHLQPRKLSSSTGTQDVPLLPTTELHSWAGGNPAEGLKLFCLLWHCHQCCCWYNHLVTSYNLQAKQLPNLMRLQLRALILFKATTERSKICHTMDSSLEPSKFLLVYEEETEIFQSTQPQTPISVLLRTVKWQNASMETKTTNSKELDADKNQNAKNIRKKTKRLDTFPGHCLRSPFFRLQ